ncbi:MAG TPA: hypothetical protein VHU42_13475 [Rhodopila sp.]|nr:hypothetical protein [Rhodopila sp.]
MQPLRRWVPGPAPDASRAGNRPVDEPFGQASAEDIAFCSQLLVHGGVAIAEDGFDAEADLLRMRQAGLLELQRDQAPPFAVTRVALSQKARERLSKGQPVATGREQKREIATAMKPATPPDSKPERMLRRNGFEVARGMLNAAVKSEIAAWVAAGGPGGCTALETRILTRISAIEAPFPI